MDFSFSDLNFNSVENLLGFEAQILYKNIVAALDKRHDFVEYQLQKYYNFRVQALTHAHVEEMSAQVEAIVAEHIPLAATADEQPQKGKRSDHDLLLDER